MADTTFKVLDKYPTEWNGNAPARRKVTSLKEAYATMRTAVQSGSTVTTGITQGKEDAGDAAIDLVIDLARLTQAYALDQHNPELYQQMRVNITQLDNMADQRLVLKLQDLLQLMVAVGQPLEEYEVTSAKLQMLAAAIQTFDHLKTAPRLTVGNRSASNATVPQVMKQMRLDFGILDNLVKGLDGASPAFVREYLSARNVINLGGRGGDTPEPPTESK